MPNKDLHALFVHTLKDVYFAEHAISKALPKMIAAAKDPGLKEAFEVQLRQTEGQIERLDKVFKPINQKAEAVPCEAIKGILKEGDEIAEDFKGGRALDAGLLAAAQAVEHYEMARYGALRTWAEEIGSAESAKLLQATLAEEQETDRQLTKLAGAKVNISAAA